MINFYFDCSEHAAHLQYRSVQLLDKQAFVVQKQNLNGLSIFLNFLLIGVEKGLNRPFQDPMSRKLRVSEKHKDCCVLLQTPGFMFERLVGYVPGFGET